MEQNWRAGLPQYSRNKIVNIIVDTLQEHTPLAGQDGMTELWKIANRFEEKIFNAASDQHDYLRKVSLKMLNLETRTALPTSSSGTSQGPLDSGITQAQSLQEVVHPLQAGMLNNGIQGSAGGEPASTFSSINNIPQPPVTNALGQVSGNLPALNGEAMQQNWRAGLTQESRNKIVNRIMDTLQRHTPLMGQDGMTELWKIANRLEENIFYAASGQHDYLRKVSLKMLNLETTALPTSSVEQVKGLRTLAQSQQQLVQPVQAGMLNNGIQGSAGGEPASTFFSSINKIPQPPVMNALGQVSGNLPALNGGSLSDNTIGTSQN